MAVEEPTWNDDVVVTAQGVKLMGSVTKLFWSPLMSRHSKLECLRLSLA